MPTCGKVKGEGTGEGPVVDPQQITSGSASPLCRRSSSEGQPGKGAQPQTLWLPVFGGGGCQVPRGVPTGSLRCWCSGLQPPAWLFLLVLPSPTL